ncbi:protein-L-isoaspartate(D-aspartate) O-methyltransferase [Jannaschia sp. CCS1]|uniref:Protein-L-isoaspartate O-methyltransferase n=1 Tax=Jannaschia sp. (strain CCS1) TaxID=290400 RepID=PIMT_JANSC|nr:protein-L-isoaspartate(D-aspartate) O-methyltransferase [Jannaschia sp. CCS1]Q28TH8.1 RecName: Full=Protein-L-isoaspartate O-methyltransferase; AltName: Full=L-isoaspartyl protein carboxyl methyltransferase; AltName: Full=Protein L-isoaspartyl methyltransferase; AltName: Full=Protein-beta-aspartate methyltransferase; Short=PIMT [Jannaschia sp. CCS1]ABD53984.1 protein-L-isoaspartate O-methyltransferase [Jannaschia sp. CCS1]
MSDLGRGEGTGFDAERKMQFLYQLRQKGVMDKRVLTAMEHVDRGAFVRGHFASRAYEDVPLPISSGQTISQPSVVGLMTQALNVQPRDTVLEVGTGSGYQAAILSHLARRIYTIDRHRNLTREAEIIFTRMGLVNITVLTRDGSFGLPDQGPFDRILITAAAEDPPGPLLQQLKVGGVMVVPVGQSDTVQSLIKVTRLETGFDYDELMPVRFVPLVEGTARD